VEPLATDRAGEHLHGGLAAQFADTDRAQPIRAGSEQAPMPLMQAGQLEGLFQ
jgi:hypothetical protein